MADFVFLDRHPLADQYSLAPYSRTGFVDIESGARRARPRFTFHPYKVSMRWLFTTADYQEFRDWHTDTINQGADSFRMNLLLPEGFKDVSARFLEPYIVDYAGPGLFYVSMVVELSDEMTVLLSTYSISTSSSDESNFITSAAVTSDVIGGLGPYVYEWTRQSGDELTLVSGATSSSQVFQSPRPEEDETLSAVYKLTVTDANSITAYAYVAVSHVWTQVPDEYFSSVVALLHFNGTDGSTTFTDVKSNVWTAYGDAQIDTSQKVFGTASGLFDGTGDHIRTPATTNLEFRAGAFTVEGRCRLASFATGCALFARMSSSNNITFEHEITIFEDRIEFYYGRRGINSSVTRFFLPASLVLNTFAYVVLQRNGSGNFQAYLNGTPGTQYQTAALGPSPSYGSIVTGTYTNAVDLGSNSMDFSIAGDPLGIHMTNGHWDEVRITKGVARYSGSFTPSAYPFSDS
jgi:hypothetical protein